MPSLESGAASGVRSSHLNFYTIFIVFFMSLNSLLYGMTGSIIGTTFGQPSFFKAMGLDESNTASLTGAMNSLYYTGGIFGAICHSWVADRFGRKMDVISSAVLILVSQALIAGSVNPAMFIVFRFFCGWGGFQLLSAVPLWIAEIVPAGNRGVLSDISAMFITFGYCLSGYIGVGFYFLDSPNAWRGPMFLCMFPGVISMCGIYWMPETPRYLLMKKRYDEAWRLLCRLRKNSKEPDNEFAKREYYQMHHQILFDASLNEGWINILKRKSYRKRAFISMSLTVCGMSSGLLTIINYGVEIYKDLGYNSLQTLLFTAGYYAWAFALTIMAMTIVDRVRRNILMGVGFAGCCVAVTCEMILAALYLNSDNKSGLAAAVACFFIYMLFYNMCIDGPAFFYNAEIWPTHMRAKGMSIAMAFYSGINIVWLQAAPTAFKNIGWKYYIFFIIFAALGSFCAFFIYPNTLHKPLEEIAAMFKDYDLVQVYQNDIDTARVPLETIEEVIPGLGRTGRNSKSSDVQLELVEKGGSES